MQQNKNLVSLLTIHTYPDRWLQHLQSESNHVYQLDLKGSPQVEFQSHGIPPGLEELIQSPAQRRQNCEQLHLWKCHWISMHNWLQAFRRGTHYRTFTPYAHQRRSNIIGWQTPLTSQFLCMLLWKFRSKKREQSAPRMGLEVVQVDFDHAEGQTLLNWQ